MRIQYSRLQLIEVHIQGLLYTDAEFSLKSMSDWGIVYWYRNRLPATFAYKCIVVTLTNKYGVHEVHAGVESSVMSIIGLYDKL